MRLLRGITVGKNIDIENNTWKRNSRNKIDGDKTQNNEEWRWAVIRVNAERRKSRGEREKDKGKGILKPIEGRQWTEKDEATSVLEKENFTNETGKQKQFPKL